MGAPAEHLWPSLRSCTSTSAWAPGLNPSLMAQPPSLREHRLTRPPRQEWGAFTASRHPHVGQAGRAKAGCQPWFSSMSVTQGGTQSGGTMVSPGGGAPPAPARSCRFSAQRGLSQEGFQAAGKAQHPVLKTAHCSPSDKGPKPPPGPQPASRATGKACSGPCLFLEF